jgi:hypothetical protein
MAGAVGKYAANKFLKKQMKQYNHKDVASDYVRPSLVCPR